ncbi:amylo-alpha-1,6-glucosidase [Phytohabitans houttuyneae]|uniref:amylo-alpha-1,6-glucosidase n=1 Tax=Phytohabitans houttuyneae TaxID=1076126 RepID=UPI0015669564|nr:amylo-alpha-1,6-glucosidase [Phytohabitans houttuyneae]
MIPIGFGPQVCGDLSVGATREWLLTDGLGGYAMGTVAGLRTRRYHALLVVSGDVPASRHVGLVSLDPVVTLPSGAQVRLATHEWASGAIEPKGHHLIERFDLADGLPRWRWRIGDVVIEREIAMVHGRPAVAVVHRLIAGEGVRLALEAICTWRDAHGERRADGPPPRVIPTADGAVVEQAYRMAGPGWSPAGQWWRGVHHREEAARGLTSEEDAWYAGRFGGTLDTPGDTLEVLAWAGDLDDRPAPAAQVVAAARERHWKVIAAATPADPVDATLALAADAFVVRTSAGPDVVAGYPWFGAWSRDTMTSYAGLFLATGRAQEGRELLRGYAGTLSRGMLANTADTGSVEYNTCDATMWFLHAVDRHVALTGDTDLAAELLPALRGVVDAHLAGTRYGIRVDPADGLVTQGSPGEALTWMDARVYGVPVTPRAGKPVEVNALWVNGLAAIVDLAARVGQDPGAAASVHTQALASFRARYPCPAGWLYDVLDGPGGNDMSLRPNQLLAWSLPHAPLEPDESALRTIGAALMTPLGPRSLAPDSPGFTGNHRGTPAQRDAAYHQGTVWPWTMGPYADAVKKAGRGIGELFTGIESHLPEFGLASVSETADGYAPHVATGCPFQGWSVAEALRARRF